MEADFLTPVGHASCRTPEVCSKNRQLPLEIFNKECVHCTFYWFISSRIAGPGELFSSDFRACSQRSRWATRCSFGSVSCSCDAAPWSAVLNRALPVAGSPLSEQRRTWVIFAEQVEIFRVKAWLATFKARNTQLKLLDDRRKKKKKLLDRPAEGAHVHLRRSIFDLLSRSRRRSLSKLSCSISLRQDPLEAILVIFGRRALIFFCLKALGKN